MSQYLFGAGVIWGTPLQDASGNPISNPTPVQLAVSQEISLDVSFDTKKLYGQNQFPVAVGRGQGSLSGKAKFAQVNGAAFNSLFFGQTMTSGLLSSVYDVTGAVIPSTPFQITPTVPGSGTFGYDLGVRDANGRPMTRVATAPATGQYTVTAGVYLFATADVGKTVFISYQYTSATPTTATKSTVMNLPMGYAPTFQADIYVPYQGKSLQITLFQALASKLSFQTKLDDFMVPELDFDAYANPAGQVMQWSLSE